MSDPKSVILILGVVPVKKLLLVFAATMASASWSVAQPGQGGRISPVPIWPVDGLLPPEMDKQYAFLDVNAGQLVLAIPEHLGDSKYELDPGPRRILRFDLQNQVRPSLSLDVRVSGAGFQYSYRVGNGEGARKSITAFDIVVPPAARQAALGSLTATPSEYVMSWPPNWKGSANSTKSSAVKASIGVDATAYLSWFQGEARSSRDPTEIVPGAALEGFEVESGRRPGLTTAYFRGGAMVNLTGDLPEVVLKQAAPVLRREFSNQQVITVAPMFEATVPKLLIVADFYNGIERLVVNRMLDGNAPAVKEALAVLGRYMAAARAVHQEIDSFVGPSLTFKERPKAGLEAEVLGAMKLSLHD